MGFVLAGRFHGGDVEPVVDIIERHGGAVVARRVERHNPGPARAGAGPVPPARSAPTSVGRNRLRRPLRARNRRPAAFLRSRAAWERRLRA